MIQSTIKSPLTWIVGALALGYALYARYLADVMFGPGNVGVWDLLLETSMSPQYLTFVCLPCWLGISLLMLRKLANPPHLVRFGSGTGALRWISIQGTLRVLLLAAVVLAAASVASAGLPLPSAAAPNTIGSLFRDAGITPVLALGLQLLLVTVVLVVMQALLMVVLIATRRWSAVIVLATAIWVWSVASAVGVVPPSSAASAGWCLDVSGALREPTTAAVAYTVVAVVAAVVVVWVWSIDRRARYQTLEVSPTVVYLVGGFIITALWIAFGSPERQSAFDAVSSALFGVGQTITQLLIFCFVFVGAGVASLVRLLVVSDAERAAQLVRFGSRLRWAVGLAWGEGLRAAAAFAGLLVLAGACYVALGGQDFSQPAVGLGIWLYQILVNGTLQVVVCVWACVLAFTVGSRAWSLGVIAALLIMLIATGGMKFSPLGGGATARLDGGWADVLIATLTLTVTALALGVAFVTAHAGNTLRRKART
ncbi:hypothetical protein [Luethyella okanaganae]|uniref:ABC-2 family transporter protein n=1 Tax=Luethyella okanaganae TaxID=69372 RepID=A0ABW1VJF0_9MICO